MIDVFRYFEENGQFVCYPGQSKETVTVMFNLYRASQLLFPGEKILYDAKNFSHKFLMEKVSSNMLLDRWVISKDLPGEVRYALDVPWYASLPRLEARFYLEQYGGEDDVWIGKTLYRLPNVNNNKYLEMAKLDYNHCQAIHQSEWTNIKKWYAHLNIGENPNTRLLWSYYMAAASIFEPERQSERIAWAKTNTLRETITSFFATSQLSNTQAFIEEFTNPKRHCDDGQPWYTIMNALRKTINQISSKAQVDHGVDIYSHLQNAVSCTS
ncbi:ent-copalyl diphosphate synthase 5-like [Bidens hawaiensis]|uniref:ent-copalyl diphosphate synthase 5-like n=1 Tax=Bidens hawaiensis TaxID=980011 RepID=UPI00404B85B6